MPRQIDEGLAVPELANRYCEPERRRAPSKTTVAYAHPLSWCQPAEIPKGILKPATMDTFARVMRMRLLDTSGGLPKG